MRKNYCIVCAKYRKCKNPKISCFWKKKKKKNISFICGKCCNKDKKTFKEEESIEI